jgi:hypothetical protein
MTGWILTVFCKPAPAQPMGSRAEQLNGYPNDSLRGAALICLRVIDQPLHQSLIGDAAIGGDFRG